MIAITRWHWALATGFWSFLAAVNVAQGLWLAQMERINLSAALTLQLAYCAAWVPVTIAIWRLTAGWAPETGRAWARFVARHLLIFAIVFVLVTLVTTAVAIPLRQIPGRPSQAFWMQIRGRGYLTLLTYIIVAGGGAAMTLHDRYRERQAAAAALHVGLPEGWTMTASRGTGLRNLASRLAAEFGDQAMLDVSARDGGGVRASITLPFVRA